MNITKLTSTKTICNSYLIEEGGFVVIIDPGQDGVVETEIDSKGYTPEYILLTHEHFDHVQDLEAVRSKYNIPVVASKLCSERLGDPKTNLSIIEDILSYYKTGVVSEEKSPRFVCGEAEITFVGEYELQWRGHQFAFIEAPGHSPGGVLIILDGDHYFTGDYMLFNEETTLRLRGGSEEDFVKITEPIINGIPDGVIIHPGHGATYIKGQEGETK
ncbi:MAG: MBL fold metallo-hydrolase [Firmicutes bacterium]|nr:MBL fold metallo-hydrolase [Bacillota bacterium]